MGCHTRFELVYPVSQTGSLTTRIMAHGCRWIRTTDDFLMKEAFYQLNYTTWRKMLDSNQRRYYPHGLANRCINRSANLPKWKQLDLNQWSFDYQSKALPTKLCFQSLRDRIWTCDLSVPNTQLYQTELLPDIFLTGFEPVLPPWKGGDLTASR